MGNVALMEVLREMPRLEAAVTRLRMAHEALSAELGAIEEYAAGPWFSRMNTECERRRAIAYEQFGQTIHSDVQMILEAAGTHDERHATPSTGGDDGVV
jgi:hypothetical protein